MWVCFRVFSNYPTWCLDVAYQVLTSPKASRVIFHRIAQPKPSLTRKKTNPNMVIFKLAFLSRKISWVNHRLVRQPTMCHSSLFKRINNKSQWLWQKHGIKFKTPKNKSESNLPPWRWKQRQFDRSLLISKSYHITRIEIRWVSDHYRDY